MSECCEHCEQFRLVITELLRLYDWRKELGKEEEEIHSRRNDSAEWRPRIQEMTRKLRLYGEQKKKAWEAARATLSASEEQLPEVPLDKRT